MIPHSKSKVYFFFDGVKLSLRKRSLLKRFIEGVFKKERKKLGSLNYVFCTDKRLLQINRQYLKHDYYTDIISFDLSKNKGCIQAEVYISLDRVKENATTLGTSFKSELYRIIFHGTLHFCGYNDKKESEAIFMRKKEDYYLSSYLHYERFM